MSQVWGIKLGSGGSLVPFCERHEIVGIGWQNVKPSIILKGNRSEIAEHLKEVYKTDKLTNAQLGSWTGSLLRFIRDCQVKDYVLYYDPPNKHVRICRVTSKSLYRDFELEDDQTDIWQYRKVEYPIPPAPIASFFGALKGKLLGPRLAFWEIKKAFETVDLLAHGKSPHLFSVSDPQILNSYDHLCALILKRLENLDWRDWEILVADYLRSIGAQVIDSRVGGSQAVIDIEARFEHGEFIDESWFVQVKRYQERKIDWPEIQKDIEKAGGQNFCYVSVFGFTEQAIRMSAAYEDQKIILLRAHDFIPFLISAKLRPSLEAKLQFPLSKRHKP